MLRIGVDAMGGDYAPLEIVKGAISASNMIDAGSKIVLFGDKDQIEKVLDDNECSREKFEVVHATEVITMEDHPAQAFVKKPDSSIAVGFNYLQQKNIDGFASAGSTGAMLVGCMYTVKQIEGIIRPTISSIIPNSKGGSSLLLDVGLNVDSKPDVLYQYGIIGSVYAKTMMGVENPKVALLNIGEEKEKGNLATKAAYELMAEGSDFNFVGNIESKYLFSGDVDVIVCDGFVGNTVLKMAEGFYQTTKEMNVENKFIDRMNYEIVGGTPVLGINGAVIIGHGCSSALAIQNMIMQTEKTIKSDLVNKLRETFR